MAISKRLRFEILRRDNHTCRYCGASAPEVKLTVDHVTPEALGGRTEASNLVAACAGCNSGKTSIAPDAALVDDVSNDAVRWARAIDTAATIRRLDNEVRDAYVGYFTSLWNGWSYGPDHKHIPLDLNWQTSVERFYALNLSEDELARAVRLAMTNERVPQDSTFRYFCGICWSVIRDLQEAAAQIVTADICNEITQELEVL